MAHVSMASSSPSSSSGGGGGGEDSCPASSGECSSSSLSPQFFPTVPSVVPFVGSSSSPSKTEDSKSTTTPFAFRYYDADRVVLGKTMRDWLKFSMAYWHTTRNGGDDPFGAPTRSWPWDDGSDSIANAERRLDAFFELMTKLGVNYWCFHDRDLAPPGANVKESRANLETLTKAALKAQKRANATVLWGTAQLFKEPHYAQGAGTSPSPEVFAAAAAQVRAAMDATHALGGIGYVFWGGREGYQTLLNTDMELEMRHMASLLRMAAQHKKKVGFKGTLLIEPKPQEPMKHQYDYDVATTAMFLARHGLDDGNFMINVECNHATLSGHSCFHELETARMLKLLGNLDANTGDAQTGWDTDEFLTDPREATLVMLSVIRNGGLPVGINFDAKLRRESTDPEDLAIAHISGMDALARGLLNAAAIVEGGELDAMVKARYERWTSSDVGRAVESGKATLESLEKVAEQLESAPHLPSGKQERYEQILASYVR